MLWSVNWYVYFLFVWEIEKENNVKRNNAYKCMQRHVEKIFKHFFCRFWPHQNIDLFVREINKTRVHYYWLFGDQTGVQRKHTNKENANQVFFQHFWGTKVHVVFRWKIQISHFFQLIKSCNLQKPWKIPKTLVLFFSFSFYQPTQILFISHKNRKLIYIMESTSGAVVKTKIWILRM